MLSAKRKILSMSAVALELPRILSRVPVDALASATGRCKRTCLNWIDGITAPSGPDLIACMREFDEVADAVLEASNRNQPGLTHAQRSKLLSILGEK